MIRLLTLAAGWGLSGAAAATVSAASASASRASQSLVGVRSGSGFDYAALGQLLFGLVLVLLLFVGLAWLFRRSGVAGGLSHAELRVIASLPLGTRERAVLVQVGAEQLLLGVAPGRVALLEHFDQPVIDPGKPSGAPFAQWLQRAIHQQQSGGSAPKPESRDG